MSNGLEREFPEVAWPAVPPIGPRGMPPEPVRDHVARGRELHSRATRDSVRSGLDAIAGALLAVFRIRRDPARSPSERDSWARPKHGA